MTTKRTKTSSLKMKTKTTMTMTTQTREESLYTVQHSTCLIRYGPLFPSLAQSVASAAAVVLVEDELVDGSVVDEAEVKTASLTLIIKVTISKNNPSTLFSFDYLIYSMKLNPLIIIIIYLFFQCFNLISMYNLREKKGSMEYFQVG